MILQFSFTWSFKYHYNMIFKILYIYNNIFCNIINVNLYILFIYFITFFIIFYFCSGASENDDRASKSYYIKIYKKLSYKL